MPIKTVDVKTLKQWLDNNEAVVIDVREPAEYASECIKGSKLVPLATVAKGELPACQNKKLVLHCKLGKRGNTACEKLLAEDPTLELYNLEGGIMAWMEAGLPVKKSGRLVLPLDQQVQVTVGSGVLLGVILGYFISPVFYLLSAFLGAGLLYAGISGNCMLASLLTKMPWNKK